VTVLACAGLGGCLAVPAFVGLVLGAAVWLVGRRDRALMAAGRMDPAGERLTWDAQTTAAIGAGFCLLAAATWVAVLFKLAAPYWP
jgi:hypothetical protein